MPLRSKIPESGMVQQMNGNETQTATSHTPQKPDLNGDIYSSQDVPPVQGNWVESTVTVTSDRGKQIKVKAKCLGYVFVHATLKKESSYPDYTVSSRTVGFLIAMVDTEEDAQRIGYYLMSRFAYPLSKKTQLEIVDRLPEWVKDWIRACRQKRGYLDPKPFEPKK